MNQLVPKYYDKFKCIGSECPETCCQGWPITIDKQTFNKYQKLDNCNLKKKADKFAKKKGNGIKILFFFIVNNNFCIILFKFKLSFKIK